MSWISLAANRYKLKKILKMNLADEEYQKIRLEDIESQTGLSALLAGDEKQIEREIERAAVLVGKEKDYKKPPNPVLMHRLLNLAVIAGLDGSDYSFVFERIANAKSYKEPVDQSLQYLAKVMTGKEKASTKRTTVAGHIEKDSQWFKLIKKNHPADLFDLAVTIEHPDWFMLSKFVLPLAYVTAQVENEKDWRKAVREMLAWGSADYQDRKNIIYERVGENPGVEVVPETDDKQTWRGFDAVELNESKVLAYYYLGVKWQAPLFFEELINVYKFFDNVSNDWKLVEENVSAPDWKKINGLKKQGIYVVVYDSAQAFAPEDALERACRHYDLNIVAEDFTNV